MGSDASFLIPATVTPHSLSHSPSCCINLPVGFPCWAKEPEGVT